MTTPIILDVDTGIDDSLALLYAATAPDAELVAVTTCGGNVELGPVTDNTLAVLALAGRDEVEVAPGRPAPIARPLDTTPETHGPRGVGYAEPPPSPRGPSDRDAVELIVQTARDRPGEVTLVTLGPLTNLAAAVLCEPRLPELLRAVWVMGGTFARNGNTMPRTEWNIHVDPEAARVVSWGWQQRIAHGATRLTMMGLDVTEEARILPTHLRTLLAGVGIGVPDDDEALLALQPDQPVLAFVLDALRWYFEFHARFDGFYGAFIHDPLVVAAALDPTLVDRSPTTIDIELGGRLTEGEVVADWRGHMGREANADIVTRADADTFLDRLLARLTHLAAPR